MSNQEMFEAIHTELAKINTNIEHLTQIMKVLSEHQVESLNQEFDHQTTMINNCLKDYVTEVIQVCLQDYVTEILTESISHQTQMLRASIEHQTNMLLKGLR